MDIKQLYEEKAKLEEAIQKLLNDFQTKTTIPIKEVRLNHIYNKNNIASTYVWTEITL